MLVKHDSKLSSPHKSLKFLSRKLVMQIAAVALLREFADLLHLKPQANKATITPTMHNNKMISLKNMSGRLPAVKNAFQSVIYRGYSEATCLNAVIFFP